MGNCCVIWCVGVWLLSWWLLLVEWRSGQVTKIIYPFHKLRCPYFSDVPLFGRGQWDGSRLNLWIVVDSTCQKNNGNSREINKCGNDHTWWCRCGVGLSRSWCLASWPSHHRLCCCFGQHRLVASCVLIHCYASNYVLLRLKILPWKW